MKSRSVLIVSPYPTHPGTFGRSVRLRQLISSIGEIGWNPVLLYQDFLVGDRKTMESWLGENFIYVPYRAGGFAARGRRILRNLFQKCPSQAQRILKRLSRLNASHSSGYRIELDDWFDSRLSEKLLLLHRSRQFDAVIAQDIFFSKALESFGHTTRRILDTHDLYALGRNSREMASDPRWLQISAEDERAGYLRSDEVWAIQAEEAEVMRKEVPKCKVRVVGHRVPIELQPIGAALASRSILFVASKHQHNIAALRWFSDHVFPLLKEEMSPQQVCIVGDIDQVLGRELPFRFLGRVNRLDEAYRNSRIVICPIQSGSGLKIKAVETLAYGRPLISTPQGVVGIEQGTPPAFIVAESPHQFAASIRRLMSDDRLCQELIELGAKLIQRSNVEVNQAVRCGLEGLL